MNNEEITEKLNPDNNILDTMESLIEEFSPKEILERGEIVDGTVISIHDNGLVVDLGQKSEGFVPKNEMKYEDSKIISSYLWTLLKYHCENLNNVKFKKVIREILN